MNDEKISARFRADLGLLFVTAIWGATFVMVKEAVASSGPLTFLALRFSLAGLVLAPLVYLRGRKSVGWGVVANGSLVGFVLCAAYFLQTAGLRFTSASKAGFITGLSVVIVPLLVGLLRRKAPGRAALVGALLATVGLALLSLADDLSIGPGELLVFGCALGFALHILLVGHFSPRHDVLALTACQIVAAALLYVLGAMVFESPTLWQLAVVLPAALFTGLLATVAAFLLQTHAQRFTSPTHTALIFTMEPVFAALFGYLLAGEQLDTRGLIGCALILAGMLVAQLPRLATTSSPSRPSARTRPDSESGRSRQSG